MPKLPTAFRLFSLLNVPIFQAVTRHKPLLPRLGQRSVFTISPNAPKGAIFLGEHGSTEAGIKGIVKDGGPNLSMTGKNYGGESNLGPALYITSEHIIAENFAKHAAAKADARSASKPSEKTSIAYVGVYVDKDSDPVQFLVQGHRFGEDFTKILEANPNVHVFQFDRQAAITGLARDDKNVKFYLVPSPGILFEPTVGFEVCGKPKVFADDDKDSVFRSVIYEECDKDGKETGRLIFVSAEQHEKQNRSAQRTKEVMNKIVQFTIREKVEKVDLKADASLAVKKGEGPHR